MSSDHQNDNKQLDWHARWAIGDEQAYAEVEAMHLPKQLQFREADFKELGMIADQAIHLMTILSGEFGENLPFVFGIAIRMGMYTALRSGLPIDHKFSAYGLPYDEDSISINFRLDTPLSTPIAGDILLIAEAIVHLGNAAIKCRQGSITEAFDEIFEASSRIATASSFDNGRHATNHLIDKRKTVNSNSGTLGAKKKNEVSIELGIWAVEKAKQRRGPVAGIARDLVRILPAHLKEKVWVLIDPERSIRDAIYESKKHKQM